MSAQDAEAEVLATIGFLNEVMARYPDAISFAPGAPVLTGIDRDRLIAAVDVGAELLGAGPQWTGLFPYGPSHGVINSLLAGALNRNAGLAISGPDLTVTVGAQEAFLLVLRALELNRAGTLGIVAPAFAGIRGAATFLDVRTADVLEGPDGVTVAAFEQACADALAAGAPMRALYVAPDHSNPSGAMLSLSARRELLEAARDREVLLIEDTTYGFTDPDVPPSLKALETDRRVIQVGTFSKLCLPGLRVGYVVADQPWRASTLASWLAALKNMTTVNTAALNQAAVAGLILADPSMLAERGRSLAAEYRHKRSLLLQALADEFPDAADLGIAWNQPTGGFFVVLSTGRELGHEVLEHCALRHRVLWTPMRDFYAGTEGDRQLRLSCSFAPPEHIREGVRRLGDFLREPAQEAA